MDEAHEQAKRTRAENDARRSAARADMAERRAEIMAALAAFSRRQDVSAAQILEAAKLAIQLEGQR